MWSKHYIVIQIECPILLCVESLHPLVIGAVGSREGAHLWNSSLSLSLLRMNERTNERKGSTAAALLPLSPSLFPGSPLSSPSTICSSAATAQSRGSGPAGDAEGGQPEDDGEETGARMDGLAGRSPPPPRHRIEAVSATGRASLWRIDSTCKIGGYFS